MIPLRKPHADPIYDWSRRSHPNELPSHDRQIEEADLLRTEFVRFFGKGLGLGQVDHEEG